MAEHGHWAPQVTERLRHAVGDVVARQAELEIDVVDDGEFGKTVWMWYVRDRLDGIEARDSHESIEVLNHTLAGLPEDRIRYHLCWGSWHGPHAHDVPLRDIIDIVLGVRAGGYVIEAANSRHEHGYHLWEDVALPEGKVLAPGVVTHAANIVEHSELVAERICCYAERVGRENVIAGADCGFGSPIHPRLGWAKLSALVEGAALATTRLYPSRAS